MKRVYLKVKANENKVLDKGTFPDTMWRVNLVANNPNPIVVSPGSVEPIPLGIAIKVARDTEVKLLLNSDFVNGKGITALNSSFVCTNRNDYSSELIALLFNVGIAGNCTIKKGDVLGVLAFGSGEEAKIDLLIEGDDDKITFWEPILISTNRNPLEKYVGFYSISADVGIGILPIEQTVDNINVCVSEFLVGNVPTKRRKTKVHYAPNGRAYITRLGENYFIDEFMKLR